MKQDYFPLSRVIRFASVFILLIRIGSSKWDPVEDFFQNCLQLNQTLEQLGFPAIVSPANGRSSVHLITSVTPNILEYANFSTAINQAYAFYRGYTFSLIQEDKNALGFYDKYDEDSRWNKVKYLWEVVDNIMNQDSAKGNSQGKDQYVVWLDADLIVVNFHFDINLLVPDYPEAHILMSTDKKDAPFVGNTGCIIVKVSSWSRSFLNLWWNTYDRQRCCDQNALTWLYDRQLPADIQSKLVFLPSHTLNTEFPAYLGPDRYHNMLHLAGMNTIYRVDIFATAYHNLQAHLAHRNEHDDNFPPFLGVDYQLLQEKLWELDYHRVCALQRLQVRLDWILGHPPPRHQPPSSSVVSHLSDIDHMRRWLNDVTKRDDDEEGIIVQHMAESASFQVSPLSGESVLREQQQQQERNALASNLSGVLFDVHLGMRNVLYTHLQAQSATLLSPCAALLPHLQHQHQQRQSLSGDSLQALQPLKHACHKGLLLYQDVITSTFELILSRNPYPQPLEAIHMLDVELSPLFADVLQCIPDEIKGIRSKFVYYRFKQRQLLADIYHQKMIVDQQEKNQKKKNSMMDESTSLTEENETLQRQEETTEDMDAYLAHLTAASQLWQELIETYQYYGTEYVTVDPHKEYVDLAMRLGVLRCQRRQYEVGLGVLEDARVKQEAMVAGYETLRIATMSVMTQGRRTLSEIYYNLAVCGYELLVSDMEKQSVPSSTTATTTTTSSTEGWIDRVSQWIAQGEHLVTQLYATQQQQQEMLDLVDAFAQISKKLALMRKDDNRSPVKKFRKKAKKITKAK